MICFRKSRINENGGNKQKKSKLQDRPSQFSKKGSDQVLTYLKALGTEMREDLLKWPR